MIEQFTQDGLIVASFEYAAIVASFFMKRVFSGRSYNVSVIYIDGIVKMTRCFTSTNVIARANCVAFAKVQAPFLNDISAENVCYRNEEIT